MKSKIFILIISILLIGFIFSCKKYDYGPFISLKSKEKRVCQTWILSQAKDGDTLDVTAKYLNFFSSYHMQFNTDGTCHTIFIDSVGNEVIGDTSAWEFQSSYFEIVVSTKLQAKHVYEILKLTSKELWIEKVGENNDFLYFDVKK